MNDRCNTPLPPTSQILSQGGLGGFRLQETSLIAMTVTKRKAQVTGDPQKHPQTSMGVRCEMMGGGAEKKRVQLASHMLHFGVQLRPNSLRSRDPGGVWS